MDPPPAAICRQACKGVGTSSPISGEAAMPLQPNRALESPRMALPATPATSRFANGMLLVGFSYPRPCSGGPRLAFPGSTTGGTLRGIAHISIRFPFSGYGERSLHAAFFLFGGASVSAAPTRRRQGRIKEKPRNQTRGAPTCSDAYTQRQHVPLLHFSYPPNHISTFRIPQIRLAQPSIKT
jgi:hypothetical protein